METSTLASLLIALQAMTSAMAELEEKILSDPEFVEIVLGCQKPCVVTHNPGGSVPLFLLASRTVHNAQLQITVVGQCYSACALFADRARPYVCITVKASMHFHKGTQEQTGARFVPSQSSDIDRWVQEHGGYPEEGFLTMTYPETAEFWPVCPGN